MIGPRFLLGYPYYPTPYRNVERVELEYHQRLRAAGFAVESFCLTLNPPGPPLTFAELDARWRRGDRELLTMYERLEERLDGVDVLYNLAGLNLHPEFVERLPVYTVFQCFDDPESSENLSRPVAHAYDLCLVGNVAEVETYRSWGVKEVTWIPMGYRDGFYDPSLTEEQILEGKRDIDLFMVSDLSSPWRRNRLERLAGVFSDAHFYGRGWPRGFLPEEKERELIRRAKIGPNLHNTTGPINFRTYCLPANGVLQVCDNARYLGKVFEVGKEVVGFETVEECIDMIRYYLAHERERREIAAAGWRRATRDYNEVSVFRRALEEIERRRGPAVAPNRNAHDKSGGGRQAMSVARSQRHATIAARWFHDVLSLARRGWRRIKKGLALSATFQVVFRS